MESSRSTAYWCLTNFWVLKKKQKHKRSLQALPLRYLSPKICFERRQQDRVGRKSADRHSAKQAKRILIGKIDAQKHRIGLCNSCSLGCRLAKSHDAGFPPDLDLEGRCVWAKHRFIETIVNRGVTMLAYLEKVGV